MLEKDAKNSRGPEIQSRLTQVDRTQDLLPIRRAAQLTRCFLYWLPVDSMPIPGGQRAWLMRFLDCFGEILRNKFALRAEVFLQVKTIYPVLEKAFIGASMEFSPLLGLARRPASALPVVPTSEEVKAFLSLEKKFDPDRTLPDYCYWFLDKLERKQRELFFGHGGLTIIFLKPDPNTVPPKLPFSAATRKQPVFQRFDVDKIHARSFSLLDGFLENSKKLFGSGLEESALRGVPYVLPLLHTGDFFNRPGDEVDKWFELFDLYIRESPEDKGVLVAAKTDVEDDLIGLLKKMREEEGLEYPAR